MPLEHYDWDTGDVVVLHLMGALTLGQGTRKLRNLIEDSLDNGKKKIVLDMSEVPYFDSSGLGELVASYTTVTRRGGVLKLAKLTRRVQDIVQLTKVYRLFETFEDVDAAVRSFQQQS